MNQDSKSLILKVGLMGFVNRVDMELGAGGGVEGDKENRRIFYVSKVSACHFQEDDYAFYWT